MELSTISVDKEIRDKLNEPFPKRIIKTFNGHDYVAGQVIIDKLNNTFGVAGWSWDIVREWISQSVDFKEQSQNPTAMVIGKLTVYFERPDGSLHVVTRMAPGSQQVKGGQSVQEDVFKGAHTDALKKAATTFGIALELYRNEKEQEYFEDINKEPDWTEELKEEYKEDLEYIEEYIKDMSIQEQEDLIEDFTNGERFLPSDLRPEEIKPFVEFLDSAD